MLVSAYRNGPLRNGLSKGYVVAADHPARVTQTLLRDMTLAATLRRYGMRIRIDDQRPAALWIDTGPVWLASRESRARLLKALADAVSSLADAVKRGGGDLVPAAARVAGTDRWSWLCEDQHSVEVVNERQREVCSNLFRRWVPELIALTGRAAFGGDLAGSRGSRRLADATDQVPARYIASASDMHLERVRQALRRDEGVSRLDVMDVNPLGDEGTSIPNVAVRCIDAQVFPAMAVTHAVLLQALAMKARKLEKEGKRFPAVPQPMLDRNRSRAVASGLSARLEVELDQGARNRVDRGQGQAQLGTRSAAESVMALTRELLPELRAMEVSAAELMPVVAGISLHTYYPDAVRTENDLFVTLRRANGRGLDMTALHALLSNRDTLLLDQITRANARVSAGGIAVVESYWGDLLARRESRGSGGSAGPDGTRRGHDADGGRPDGGREQLGRREAGTHDERRTLAEATLVAALAEANGRDAAIAAIHQHLASGWRLNLATSLRRADSQDARQIRRMLRPPGTAVLHLRDSTDIPGRHGKTIMDKVSRDGLAFIALDLPADGRTDGVAAVEELRKSLPHGVATVLVTNAVFHGQSGMRASLEALVLDTRGQR
jgi:hypothetical protein